MKARTVFFEKKLERSGVKVPRASILMTQGLNAPLLAVSQGAQRSQSMVNQPREGIDMSQQQRLMPAQSMVTIKEEND